MSNCFDQSAGRARRALAVSGRRQRGDMLLEALLGLLLLSILGVGMAQVAANIQGAQRDTRVEGLAVIELRRLLREEGMDLCAGPATRQVALGGEASLAVDVQVTCDPVPPQVAVSATGAGTITVEAPPAVMLSVDAAQLGLAEGPALVVGTQQ